MNPNITNTKHRPGINPQYKSNVFATYGSFVPDVNGKPKFHKKVYRKRMDGDQTSSDEYSDEVPIMNGGIPTMGSNPIRQEMGGNGWPFMSNNTYPFFPPNNFMPQMPMFNNMYNPTGFDGITNLGVPTAPHVQDSDKNGYERSKTQIPNQQSFDNFYKNGWPMGQNLNTMPWSTPSNPNEWLPWYYFYYPEMAPPLYNEKNLRKDKSRKSDKSDNLRNSRNSGNSGNSRKSEKAEDLSKRCNETHDHNKRSNSKNKKSSHSNVKIVSDRPITSKQGKCRRSRSH